MTPTDHQSLVSIGLNIDIDTNREYEINMKADFDDLMDFSEDYETSGFLDLADSEEFSWTSNTPSSQHSSCSSLGHICDSSLDDENENGYGDCHYSECEERPKKRRSLEFLRNEMKNGLSFDTDSTNDEQKSVTCPDQRPLPSLRRSPSTLQDNILSSALTDGKRDVVTPTHCRLGLPPVHKGEVDGDTMRAALTPSNDFFYQYSMMLEKLTKSMRKSEQSRYNLDWGGPYPLMPPQIFFRREQNSTKGPHIPIDISIVPHESRMSSQQGMNYGKVFGRLVQTMQRSEESKTCMKFIRRGTHHLG